MPPNRQNRRGDWGLHRGLISEALMKTNQIISGLDVMVQYSTELRNKLLDIRRTLAAVNNHTAYNIDNLDQDLKIIREEAIALGRILRKEVSIRHPHPQIHAYLKSNIKGMKGNLVSLQKLIDDMLDLLRSRYFKKVRWLGIIPISRRVDSMDHLNEAYSVFEEKTSKHFLPELEHLIVVFGRLIDKDIYEERFLYEVINVAHIMWQKHIRNREFWLYHGTSILFLSNMQKYGLDNKKVTRGVTRAIESISKIYGKYGIDGIGSITERGQDIDIEFSEKKIYLAFGQNVLGVAAAPALPAFLYELLNENNIKKEYREKLLTQLSADERFLVRAIWRFSRMLRKKNKMILLHIKLNSRFLKYYGFPDFISSFDKFLSSYVFAKMSLISGQSPSQLIKLPSELGSFKSVNDLIANIFDVFYRAGYLGPKAVISGGEFRVTDVPVEFIYVEVSGMFDSGIIPLTKLNEGMIKNLVTH